MKEKNENKAQKAKIDPALVAQARTGDQSAFTALYEQTHTAIYRSIRSMVHDEDLAWDILQDCYLKAFQGLDKLEADGAFLSWLRRIAVNETASRMSKRLPVTFTELGDGEDETMPELPDPDPEVQPELALDRQETSRLVREILAELPEQQQLIVGMRYYEDLSVKEIAELLHLTPGTIKTQLHFGRKKVETKVRALEKQGLKLYGLAPFPFLLALLRNLEPGEALGQKALSTVLAQAPTAAGTAAAGGAASLGGAVCEAEAVKLTAMTAGQAIRHGLAAKLAAGALALCVIGGGIWAGGKALKRNNPDIGDPQPSITDTELPTREPTDVTAEYIQTEEPTKPGEADSQLSFDTAESAYDYVLDQYRQALADPDFTAVAYPLVNADTVSSTAMRWSKYADEEGLYAFYPDIDGNGTEELVICQSVSGALNDTLYSICAIYAWNGAEPVELLSQIGVTSNDLVDIYDSGVIRCVKNGYYTSPAQVTEYRLDAAQAALREEQQWTYTCTEKGAHSYRSADGSVLTPEEFYADCGSLISFTYRTWDAEASQWRVQNCFVSNPGTAEAAPVKDREDLPEEKEKNAYYRLPQITLEGEAFENFNREIQEKFLTEGGEYFDWNMVVYDWSLNGDILCVHISEAYAGIFPIEFRYFSVSEARELTEDELLERRGVSRAAFDAGLLQALYGEFFIEFDHELYIPGGNCYGEDTSYCLQNMPSYTDSARLTLDRYGRLVCIARVSSMAGGDSYDCMIPVLWCD
jgi:RNA polymerase sigma factor (sigma-70 family)